MKTILATALLCSAAITPALAQSARYYGAADYGTVSYSGPGSYSSPGALTLSGGYHYLPNLDLEAGLTLIGTATGDVPGTGRVSINQNILSVVAVGKVPLNNSVNLFGKAGVGLHDGGVNGLPDDLIYGFGAHIRFDREFSMRVQYESLGRTKVPSTNGHADMTRLSVGVTYDF